MRLRSLPMAPTPPHSPLFSNPCFVAAFHPKSKWLVTAEESGSNSTVQLVLRSLKDGKAIQTWAIATNNVDVTHLLVHPTQDELALGFANGSIQLWNPTTRKLLRSWQAHKGSLLYLSYRSQGQTLLSIGEDQTISHWNSLTGKRIKHNPLPTSSVVAVDLSSDNKTLLTGDKNGTLQLWQACP